MDLVFAGVFDLFGENAQVDVQESIDVLLARGRADGGQAGAGDGPIGHAAEGDSGARVGSFVEALECAFDGAPPGAAGGDEGAVDVKEIDGRPHGLRMG